MPMSGNQLVMCDVTPQLFPVFSRGQEFPRWPSCTPKLQVLPAHSGESPSSGLGSEGRHYALLMKEESDPAVPFLGLPCSSWL